MLRIPQVVSGGDSLTPVFALNHCVYGSVSLSYFIIFLFGTLGVFFSLSVSHLSRDL